ncbi:MAG: hypothetical protein AAFR96_04255 [Planctomycetota bacterium]
MPADAGRDGVGHGKGHLDKLKDQQEVDCPGDRCKMNGGRAFRQELEIREPFDLDKDNPAKQGENEDHGPSGFRSPRLPRELESFCESFDYAHKGVVFDAKQIPSSGIQNAFGVHLRATDVEMAKVSAPRAYNSIALDTGSALAAACVCAVILAVFADGFANGSTWSGLNPDGGGPGFLLLLCTGAISLATFRRACPEGSVTTDVLWSAIFALACGGFLWALTLLLDRLPADSVPSLVSGVVGSFFVPRIVVSVLQDTWSRAEGAARVDTP